MSWTQSFLDGLPMGRRNGERQMRVGGVVFATKARRLNGGTLTSVAADAKAAFRTLRYRSVGDDTRLDRGVDEAQKILRAQGREGVSKVVLVMTDGVPTGGTSFGSPADVTLRRVRENGIKVNVVMATDPVDSWPRYSHGRCGSAEGSRERLQRSSLLSCPPAFIRGGITM